MLTFAKILSTSGAALSLSSDDLQLSDSESL